MSVTASVSQAVNAVLAAAGLPGRVRILDRPAPTARGRGRASSAARSGRSPTRWSSPPATGEPVLIMTSGRHRVDLDRVRAAHGSRLHRASAEFVRTHTGQPIGGVAPVGHPQPIRTLVDRALADYDQLWAAGGIPHAVFPLSYADLLRLTGGAEVDVGLTDPLADRSVSAATTSGVGQLVEVGVRQPDGHEAGRDQRADHRVGHPTQRLQRRRGRDRAPRPRSGPASCRGPPPPRPAWSSRWPGRRRPGSRPRRPAAAHPSRRMTWPAARSSRRARARPPRKRGSLTRRPWTISSLRKVETLAPTRASAPMASSGRPGAPILRTMTTAAARPAARPPRPPRGHRPAAGPAPPAGRRGRPTKHHRRARGRRRPGRRTGRLTHPARTAGPEPQRLWTSIARR